MSDEYFIYPSGMVKFGSYARTEFLLDRYTSKQALLERIKRIQRLDDETNIAGGILRMRTQVFTKPGDRPEVKDIGMLCGL